MKKEKVFEVFAKSSSTLFTAFIVDTCLLLIAMVINLITGFICDDTRYVINIITEMLHFATIFEVEFLIVIVIYLIIYFILFLKYGKEFSDYVKAHNEEDY